MAEVKGYATLTFQSDPPSQANITLGRWGGTIITYIGGAGQFQGKAILQLAQSPGPNNNPLMPPKDSSGILLSDQTKTHLWPGSFMYLQVANSTQSDNGNYWETKIGPPSEEWWNAFVGGG